MTLPGRCVRFLWLACNHPDLELRGGLREFAAHSLKVASRFLFLGLCCGLNGPAHQEYMACRGHKSPKTGACLPMRVPGGFPSSSSSFTLANGIVSAHGRVITVVCRSRFPFENCRVKA